MSKRMRWEALVKFLLALTLGVAGVASPRLVGVAYAMQIATTTVSDTVYHADGTTATGTVILNWPTFTTMTGEVIQGGSQSTTIAAGGALSVALVPNVGATPIGTYYTAVYHLDDGSVQKEFWVIPVSTAPVTVAAVKNTVLPTSVAMQTVSKSYVDTAIAAAVTGHPLDSSPYVVKTGDTMTGPLLLPGDPVSANQAADKHYVDLNIAGVTGGSAGKVALLPSGTQVVAQPAGTDLETNRLNGTEYASQYATIPNNNGVANATTSSDCTGAGASGTGCLVTVEPTVAVGERYNSANWSYQTHVKDMRRGAQHDTYLNPENPLNPQDLVGEGIDVTTTESNAALAQSLGIQDMQATGVEIQHRALAGGSNLFSQELGSVPYFKTNYVGEQVTGTYNTAGQHILGAMETFCYAVGDCLIGSQFLHSMGGYRDNSDEGTHPFDTVIAEDPRVFQGLCATGCTTGSQTLTAGSQSSGGTQGDGRYLIDKNPASVISTGTLTGGTYGPIHAVATFTGTSFPVSTFFQTAALIPSQAHNTAPGTVTVAIATTGLPAGFSTNTAAAPGSSGVACVAAEASTLPNHEMAPYTVVDGTHLQMTLLKPHGANSTIAIGGLCGYGLEQTVDTVNGVRQVFPVIGSYSSTGLYYAGGVTPIVGMMNSTSAYVNVNLSILSVARSGNLVTVTTSSGVGTDLNGLTVTIAGVADSSYNGSFLLTSTGASSFTYAQTGPNSTSTGGTLAYLTGGYALYPMAEVLSVYNAATKAVDGTFTLAPNTVAWAAGDALEQPHYFLTLIGGDTAYVKQIQPRPSLSQSLGYYYTDNVGPGLSGFQIQNTVPASSYFGNGGTHGYPNAAYASLGIWTKDFEAQAGEASAFVLHCNSKGCNRWNSAYDLFLLESSAGADTVNYAPQSSTLAIKLRGNVYSFTPSAFTANTANITTLNATTVNAGSMSLGAVTSTSEATGALTASSVASSGGLSGSSLTTGAIAATSETLTGTSTSAAVNTGVVTATTLNGALSAANVTSGTLNAARLPVMGASGASHAVGAVPDPGATAGTTRYLREDGTWVSPAGGVTAFNGRAGAVAPASGDYSVAQVTGAAPLASAALTGTPTAPTATAGDNSTKVATTAYVNAAIASGPAAITGIRKANGSSPDSVATPAQMAQAIGYVPAQAASYSSASTILGLYRFNETLGTTLFDYSGNGNNAALTMSPVQTGTGYQFTTATQQITMPAAINNTGTFYIAANFPPMSIGTVVPNGSQMLMASSLTGSASGNYIIVNLGPNSITNARTGADGIYGIQVVNTSGVTLRTITGIYAGTHIITVACPTGVAPVVYIDGAVDTTGTSTGASCSGPQASGNYLLGQSGGGTSAYNAMGLTYYAAMFASTVDSAATIATNVGAMFNQIQQQGVQIHPRPVTSTNRYFLAAGDSITCGFGIVSTPACGAGTVSPLAYPGLISGNTTYNVNPYTAVNYGHTGAVVQHHVLAAPDEYAQYCNTAGGQSIAELFEGTNNYALNTSNSTNNTFLVSNTVNSQGVWVQMMRGYGCRTMLLSMLSRTGTGMNSTTNDQFMLLHNAAMRANWKAQGAGVFVDLATNPLLGAVGASANTTNFPDGTHPSAAMQVVIAQAVGCGIDILDGSTADAMNQTPLTAATGTLGCGDGGRIFNVTANSTNWPLPSAMYMTQRVVKYCNYTPGTTSNTATLTAPSDYPFNNVTGSTTLAIPQNACVNLQAVFNGSTSAPGNYWATR